MLSRPALRSTNETPAKRLHVKLWTIVGYLAAVLIFPLSGCSKNKADTQTVSVDSSERGDAELDYAKKDRPSFHLTETASPEADSVTEKRHQNQDSEYEQIATGAEMDRHARKKISIDVQKLRKGILYRYALDPYLEPETEISYLLSRYESGDNSVAIDLALMLAHVGKTREQINQAKLILEMAAEDGDVRAYSELARLVLLGHKVGLKPEQAIGYLERAVAANDAEGTYLLGVANSMSLIPGSDPSLGLELFETAAELGHGKSAQTLFYTLDLLSKEDDESGQTSSDRFRAMASAYPNMEHWLIKAAENGASTDYSPLVHFYEALDRKQDLKETLVTSAQKGSFDSLSRIIRNDFRLFVDTEYRNSMKELLEIHIDGSQQSAGEAHYLLASLLAMDARSTTEQSEIIETLEAARDNHDYSAGYVILRVKQGADLHLALWESRQLSHHASYTEYQKLSRSTTHAGDHSIPPYVRSMSPPEYPPEMLVEGIEGQVTVEMIIDENGQIRRPRVIESSHPGFDDYALDLVLDAKIAPAMKGGKPTASRIRIPITFTPNK